MAVGAYKIDVVTSSYELNGVKFFWSNDAFYKNRLQHVHYNGKHRTPERGMIDTNIGYVSNIKPYIPVEPRGFWRIWKYSVPLTWRDFEGRWGQFSDVFCAPNWRWLAMKMARAKLSHKVRENMIIDYSDMSLR